MSWQTLGTVTPIERQWRDYAPTTQAPDSPVEAIVYRLTGLNVEAADALTFFALVRFRYGAETYSRAFRHIPSRESSLAMVEIPPEITSWPFSWVPQIQLIYSAPPARPELVNWAVRIDEFVAPDLTTQALANLQRFLY